MTAPFINPSEVPGGGNFFKPADLSSAVAILFEPKKVLESVTHTYQGKVTGVYDDIVVDMSIFTNQRDIDNATPSQVMKAVQVDKQGVTERLKAALGGAMLARLTKVSTKSGNTAWVLDDVTDPAVVEAVTNYYTARTEAAAAAPSFE